MELIIALCPEPRNGSGHRVLHQFEIAIEALDFASTCKLYRRSVVAASAASLQQNLSLRLKLAFLNDRPPRRVPAVLVKALPPSAPPSLSRDTFPAQTFCRKCAI